jgi:hypothetical protein
MRKILPSVTPDIAFRDYIPQVATVKKADLLKPLPEIDGDMQLLTSALLAAFLMGNRRPNRLPS